VTATRKFHRFTIPYLGVTVVGVIASALLIPKYGLLGAAWASAFMNFASCVAPTIILTRLHFESVYEPAS
jgi:O-antigen/teichoic acid export membrane protein